MLNMSMAYAVCCRSRYRAMPAIPRAPSRWVVTVRSLAEKIPLKTHGQRGVRSTIHSIVIGKGLVSTVEIFSAMLAFTSAMLAFNEPGNSRTNTSARPDST
jgi:hypothetical protein